MIIFKMKIFFLFLICLINFSHSIELAERFKKEIDNLVFNEDGRLAHNYVIFPDQASQECKAQYDNFNYLSRKKAFVSSSFMEDIIEKAFEIFPSNNEEGEGCSAFCLPIGLEKQFVNSPIVPQIAKNVKSIKDFVISQCQKVDIGMLNYSPNFINVYWKNPQTGNLDHFRTLKPKGDHQIQSTHIGHQFVFVDVTTGQTVRDHTVIENSYIPIGDFTLSDLPEDLDVVEDIESSLDNEWDKFHMVTRTFTEFGFKKGKLPRDIWGSMSAYYYNNQMMDTVEPWTIEKGLYVNWWEVPSYMIWIPESVRVS